VTTPAPTGEAVIRIRGITRTYGTGEVALQVLKGVDLDIHTGEVVSLVGPSGSGKSTLLNTIGCLDRPTTGTYHLDGHDVSQLSRAGQAHMRLHFLGFVFQSVYLIGELSAIENVMLPMSYAGVPLGERRKRAVELLGRVGLDQRMDHRPNQLSGGQRQRVAIARALSMKPRVLLADEPTGALDSKTGEEVLALLYELHAETRLTMVIVTHDPRIAASTPRTVHLKDGLIHQDERRSVPHVA
jgi:ABC-type lipoprotein export system ATPase subunit